MTTAPATTSNRHLDDHVDDEIAGCLNLDNPVSFFLFAGAGSGKTRSLVSGLRHIQKTLGPQLRLRGQHVGVITYTNAARDEITSRIEADPLFHVATIHSFAWTLIQGLNKDVRDWLRRAIVADIRELEEKEAKGKMGSDASIARRSQIESKKLRLERLDQINKFIYNPNGDNRESNSLNHSEVIAIVSQFISTKPTMQRILVGQYPILLVDESQDTNRAFVDALLAVEATARGNFCLGFFGDTMQRIYNDGKERFEASIPGAWAKPEKKLNHRCPKRVLRLINRIRQGVDDHQQIPADSVPEGLVRIFVLPTDTSDKPSAEKAIREQMANITGDESWRTREDCKILTLEHHMAARRMGFSGIFESLSAVDEFRTGLLDGTLPATRLFAGSILRLLTAERSGDKFGAARVVREESPLLAPKTFKESKDPGADIRRAREAVASLLALWNGKVPTCGAILANIAETKLFDIPESLIPILRMRQVRIAAASPDANILADEPGERERALESFLGTSFDEVAPYAQYVSGQAPYDTHQGVKGREFERVMVLIDDAEARGFLFGYEKLFGAKELSPTDLKNKREGRETSIDRTRRLLYVTCSRARKSLALVVYSQAPEAVRQQMLGAGWFSDDEIVLN